MESGADSLEQLWDNLLSRQPEQVRAAFLSLNNEEKKAVTGHLERMVSEPDWLPDQRRSAQAALDALADLLPPQ